MKKILNVILAIVAVTAILVLEDGPEVERLEAERMAKGKLIQATREYYKNAGYQDWYKISIDNIDQYPIHK